MSITRVNLSGWGVGDKLTSAQANGLDLNGTYALDKRSAQTDTLASTVALSGTINVGATGLVDITNATGIVRASVSGAKIAATASGATIEANANGAKIRATGAGALIRTESGGRIELADNDYPGLAVGHTGRTVTRFVRAVAIANRQGTSKYGDTGLFDLGVTGSPWAAFTDMSVSSARVQFSSVDTAQATTSFAFVGCLDDILIDGATLTGVTVYVNGANGHGGLPTRMPRFSVNRITAELTTALLHSSGSTIVDTTASTVTYDDYHSIVGTMDQNNVIDKTANSYWIGVWNEGGTNGLLGLSVSNIVLTQTITDLRTP